MNLTPIPRSVLVWGILGLVPFLLPPLLALAAPAHADLLGLVALVYAALILSFLGGARWGQAVAQPAPQATVIAGFALLLATSLDRSAQLTAMAALLSLQFVWDAASPALPGWYTRLRLLLTVGAVAGLMAMAVVSGQATALGDVIA